ncbi:hypothetical protein Gpo141_00004277 [Globisporangium polare]
MSGGRGGRRRSPIWEHFLLGKNADGNRVAQCTFCSRIMKSQPDRMENHFLKLCAQVDMDSRRRWLLDRENRESISALQRQRDEALGKVEDRMGASSNNSNSMLGGAGDDTTGSSLQAQVAAAAASGDAHLRQQFKIAEVAVDHVVDDSELLTAPPVPTKFRKTAAGRSTAGGGGGSAAKKHQQFIPQDVPRQQQQQQRNNGGNPHFSILKDVNGKTERVELENLGHMRAAEAGGLDAQTLELQKRKLEIEERKSHLQIESMRYDNDIKRIKVAEENMLARKRLRDAGVPQEEIDLLLPLQKPEVVDFQSL